MQENTIQQMKNSRRKTYNIFTLKSANYKERQFFVSVLENLTQQYFTRALSDSWKIPGPRNMMVYFVSGIYDMIWQYVDPHMTTWQNDDPHTNGNMAKWRYAYDEYHPWCTSGRVIKRSGADKHFELAAHCDMFDICLLIFGDLLQA